MGQRLGGAARLHQHLDLAQARQQVGRMLGKNKVKADLRLGELALQQEDRGQLQVGQPAGYARNGFFCQGPTVRGQAFAERRLGEIQRAVAGWSCLLGGSDDAPRRDPVQIGVISAPFTRLSKGFHCIDGPAVGQLDLTAHRGEVDDLGPGTRVPGSPKCEPGQLNGVCRLGVAAGVDVLSRQVGPGNGIVGLQFASGLEHAGVPLGFAARFGHFGHVPVMHDGCGHVGDPGAAAHQPGRDRLVDHALVSKAIHVSKQSGQGDHFAFLIAADDLGQTGVESLGVVQRQQTAIESGVGHRPPNGGSSSGDQLLVGVEDQHPVAGGGVEGGVSRGGEVVVPRRLNHLCARFARDVDRSVGAARVHDDHLIDNASH